MISSGLSADEQSVGRFIETCFILDFSHYGCSIFNRQNKPGIYLYNTLIKSVCRCSTPNPKEAIRLYDRILHAGLLPDSYTFPFVFKAVLLLREIEAGKEMHCQTITRGLGSDIYVATSLIQFYSSCGFLHNARRVFDELWQRDVILWNAMISGYAKGRDMETARNLFDHMPVRNVISWTSVISGYVQMNRPSEAISMFRRMQLEGFDPDEITILATLSACADIGALELGDWIHKYIRRKGLSKVVNLNNALIDMYAKSGSIAKAVEVFESMESRSVVSWTIMIGGLALHGLGREAIEFYFRMMKMAVKPNEITFISILSACSHAGLVETGLDIFIGMNHKYGVIPGIEHYGCIINLLGRAGYIRKALEFVRLMPFEANGAIWGSLLAAANMHKDQCVAEVAMQHLIKMEPYHCGNYMLLCNTYAALHRWKEVKIVRTTMRDVGITKVQGGSSIEVNNRVHEFMAGERSGSQFPTIYLLLDFISWQMSSLCREQMEMN